ncbi:hypothetical protein N7536_012522 [Penicillium majusculum]|nr:hypothetical protein N7536_012522 [Penicillium majusculum]
MTSWLAPRIILALTSEAQLWTSCARLDQVMASVVPANLADPVITSNDFSFVNRSGDGWRWGSDIMT